MGAIENNYTHINARKEALGRKVLTDFIDSKDLILLGAIEEKLQVYGKKVVELEQKEVDLRVLITEDTPSDAKSITQLNKIGSERWLAELEVNSLRKSKSLHLTRMREKYGQTWMPFGEVQDQEKKTPDDHPRKVESANMTELSNPDVGYLKNRVEVLSKTLAMVGSMKKKRETELKKAKKQLAVYKTIVTREKRRSFGEANNFYETKTAAPFVYVVEKKIPDPTAAEEMKFLRKSMAILGSSNKKYARETKKVRKLLAVYKAAVRREDRKARMNEKVRSNILKFLPEQPFHPGTPLPECTPIMEQVPHPLGCQPTSPAPGQLPFLPQEFYEMSNGPHPGPIAVPLLTSNCSPPPPPFGPPLPPNSPSLLPFGLPLPAMPSCGTPLGPPLLPLGPPLLPPFGAPISELPSDFQPAPFPLSPGLPPPPPMMSPPFVHLPPQNSGNGTFQPLSPPFIPHPPTNTTTESIEPADPQQLSCSAEEFVPTTSMSTSDTTKQQQHEVLPIFNTSDETIAPVEQLQHHETNQNMSENSELKSGRYERRCKSRRNRRRIRRRQSNFA